MSKTRAGELIICIHSTYIFVLQVIIYKSTTTMAARENHNSVNTKNLFEKDAGGLDWLLFALRYRWIVNSFSVFNLSYIRI